MTYLISGQYVTREESLILSSGLCHSSQFSGKYSDSCSDTVVMTSPTQYRVHLPDATQTTLHFGLECTPVPIASGLLGITSLASSTAASP
ncbi:hypothetical protein E2C01_014135 [Portunus trituberculatus]|uniref:Uncharacterized protein n=1 Tax=Portunus trituberculatus TaxID=210409 RepID=A0A5B7DJB3_PORTR|nr:hypothetical protein [Portunus trituberculatus]